MTATATVRYHDQHPRSASLRDDILTGFAASPKQTSPKHFYDAEGSRLFERICEQPEYYPTRTEEAILAAACDEIARLAGAETPLLELGSGASRKVRLLLEALQPSRYLGIDISREFLIDSTRRLAADYPWLEVHAACADFCRPLRLPQAFRRARPLAFFPGSSIGNFEPHQALDFLRHLRRLLPDGSGLLIGVDLLKDRERLEAAYNDRAGVTAAFNLNLLRRIRRELNSDIQPRRFRHRAFFNPRESRIEMHLVSPLAQQVRIEERAFSFQPGESLHTENSYKYSPDGFLRLAERAGFRSEALWMDDERLFSVHFLRSA